MITFKYVCNFQYKQLINHVNCVPVFHIRMNNQYSLKISALNLVGNVSVSSKTDHLPWQTPGKFFWWANSPPPGQKRVQNPHPQGHFPQLFTIQHEKIGQKTCKTT